jgi:hypothetical protein
MADAKTTAVDSGSNVGARMTYEDMREWIVEAEKLGELRVVNGASWEEDIGLAAEVVQHDEGAPCIVFDNVPGCPPGFRMLINFFAGKRKCMTMGFPTEWNKLELTDGVHQHMKGVESIPHKIVETGPVFENIMEGDDIDIEKFPAPMWHDKDGGRYIGTGSYNVTLDPDTNWINLGTYRVMIQSKNEVGFYISPGKHGRIHSSWAVLNCLPGNVNMTSWAAIAAMRWNASRASTLGFRSRPMPKLSSKVSLSQTIAGWKARSVNGPAITVPTFGPSLFSISPRFIIGTILLSLGVLRCVRPMSWPATVR